MGFIVLSNLRFYSLFYNSGNILTSLYYANTKNYSLIDVYAADEAFATGTFGGVAYVCEVDGRTIGNGKMGPVSRRLMDLYKALLKTECPPTAG